MGARSPLVTLAAVAAGLVALLVVNSTQTGSPTATDSAVIPSAQPTVEPPANPPASEAPASETPTTPPPETTAPPTTKPPAQATAVYAGHTREREAAVAIAVKGTRAVAYVCDGSRLEAWLTGTNDGSRVVLQSKTGERLIASLSRTQATGVLTLSGRSLRFTIEQVGPPAGLYRGKNNTSTIGWIVLPDGSQVGIDNDGTPAAAPALDPATREATVGGVSVTAQTITGAEQF